MTYRELKSQLNHLSDTELDMEVQILPAFEDEKYPVEFELAEEPLMVIPENEQTAKLAGIIL